MRGGRVVVIGGSVAGLLAAAALAEHFELVTIVERDELEDAPIARKGAPQGNQIHILLPIGERMIDALLPGVGAEFLAAGCQTYDNGADLVLLGRFGWARRVSLGMGEVIAFRRPVIEWVIRRRLLALDNVEILHASVAGLAPGADGSSLGGVILKGGETLGADLVVDAGGRGTKAPKWLRELGFGVPRTREVRIYMGYATQFAEIPDSAFEAGVRGVGAVPRPDHLTGGIVMPADNGLHAITAVGMMKRYPPGDREGMLDFLATASSPLVAEIARRSRPVSEVRTYHQPGNLRRCWEELDDRPGRFAVVGDAVASFNPVYGQGMTMAALAATRLGEALSEPGATLDSVPRNFQSRLGPEVDLAFEMAAGGDVRFDGAELINFEPPGAEELKYHDRLEALATEDADVQAALLEANLWLRPEALEAPAIKAKVDDRTPAALARVDPTAYPREVAGGVRAA